MKNIWKKICDFRDNIWTYKTNKWKYPTVFGKVQEAIANAFEIPDAQDYFDNKYSYIISSDAENNDEIISGYRYILCKDAQTKDSFNLNTFKYYNFSDKFSKDYANKTLELGRSFVNPSAKKKFWGLFSIWESGLGPLIDYQKNHNDIQYILGQVSLKESVYDQESIKAILKMFRIDFGTNDLLFPRESVFSQSDLESFNHDSDLDFSGDYHKDKIKLIKFLKKKNQPKPTLFLNYANLINGNKNGLSCFLPIYNPLLKCYEMGFLLKIDQMSPECVEKYLKTEYNSKAFSE